MTAAVTFDAGQTLLFLDVELLAARVGEQGVVTTAPALAAAEAQAWRHYEQVVAQPAAAGPHPWEVFMATLLGCAVPELPAPQAAELAAWLFSEQPRRNLWRRLMPGMMELVDELRAADVPVAIVSNSEGRLAELLADIGVGERFAAVADSGRLGIEKPDPAIFGWVASRLDVAAADLVHVGDSWGADIVGARRAGARAVWFGPAARAERAAGDPSIAIAPDPSALRAALAAWGLLPPRP